MKQKLKYRVDVTANVAPWRKHYRLFVSVFPERSNYIAYCPSLDLSSSGPTVGAAIRAFREAFRLCLECVAARKP